MLNKKYCRKNILKIKPYVAGYQPKLDKGVIKLNTNENHYPPSPKAIKIIVKNELFNYPS